MITYDKATGRFDKIDPTPNLIEHPPQPPKKQLCLEDCHRGRPSFFNAVERAWIVDRRTSLGFRRGVAMPNILLRCMLEEGVKEGVLRADSSIENLRHICRNDE